MCFLRNRFDHMNPIRIYVYSPIPAFVTVSVPLLGYSRKTFIAGSAELLIDEITKTPDQTGIYPKGFVVESSEPIQLCAEKVDVSAVIPERRLSKDYVLLSWYNDVADYEAAFGVVGTVDGTRFAIHFRNGTTWKQVVNRHELFQYRTTEDISGSFISASHKISVVAGHKCTKTVPSFCDSMYQPMPPIQALNTQFIVSCPSPWRNFAIRIVAVSHNTIVHLSNGIRFGLHRGEIAWYTFKHTAIAVTSNSPIMIAAYALGGPVKHAFDPAQMIVPGISHFKPFYGLFVPQDVYTGVMMVIFPMYTSPFPCLRLNGRMVAPHSPRFVFAPGRGNYIVFYVKVFPGENVIYATDGTHFGVYLFLTKHNTESWLNLGFSD